MLACAKDGFYSWSKCRQPLLSMLGRKAFLWRKRERLDIDAPHHTIGSDFLKMALLKNIIPPFKPLVTNP
jgi:hypothetical protein